MGKKKSDKPNPPEFQYEIKLSVCPCEQECQCFCGVHKEECGQQVEGGDLLPLNGLSEAISGDHINASLHSLTKTKSY